MNVLSLILYLFESFIFLVTLYYFFTFIFGFLIYLLTHTKSIKPTIYNNYFGVIIPAHNEESCIKDTLTSIKESTYPDYCYEIFVVADNCTDSTSKICNLLGVNVFQRTDTTNIGKGYALEWIFNKLKSDNKYNDIDVFVIIDADTVLSPDFLSRMNESFNIRDCNVVQGFYNILNPGESWVSKISYISFLFRHYNKQIFRNILGLPAFIMGNGFAIRSSYLAKNPWNSFGITEDVEYTIKIVSSGTFIYYNKEAIIFSLMPKTLKQAKTQRIRWSSGNLQLLKKYFPIILNKINILNKIRLLDILYNLIIPPPTVLIASISLILCFSILRITLFPIIIWVVILLTIVGIILTPMVLHKLPINYYLCIILLPIYIPWRIFIQILSIININKHDWIKTTR